MFLESSKDENYEHEHAKMKEICQNERNVAIFWQKQKHGNFEKWQKHQNCDFRQLF